MAAAETHLHEVWLAEDVLTRIMQPKEEPVQYKVGLTPAHIANTALNTAYNTNTATGTASIPTFAESFQREMERYKQEDFKRREYEHAMRNTKPFKGSL